MFKCLNEQSTKLAVIFCLIVLTVVPYWQVRNHGFNFDDQMYVTDNRDIQAGLTGDSIEWAFSLENVSYWHPVTWLSFMLDFQLFGLNPKGYHLNNLLLHLLNTLLLFLILRSMTGKLWVGAFVAALFALHPLNVESVAWISERKNVLSTLFWMLTMWAYANYAKRPGPGRYLLTFFFFSLGLMAKSMLVTLPFVLLLLDYWPLGRCQCSPFNRHDYSPDARSRGYCYEKYSFLRLVIEKIPLLLLSLTSVYLTALSVQRLGIVVSTDWTPIGLRISNALVSYINYIGKMLWPRDLAVFYTYPDMLPLWKSAGAGLILVGASILAIRAMKRHPYLTVGWFWYLGTLVPVMGLMQAGLWPAIADRFTYVPLIGLFIMIAWSIHDLSRRWRHRNVVLALSAGTVLVALMLCTWFQLHYWQDDARLYGHTVNVTSGNFITHNNLGNVLFQQGKLDEAVFHHKESIRIRPDHARSHYNLANVLARQGKLDEAVKYYTNVTNINPGDADAYNNRGVVLAEQGKLAEAIALYSEAIRISPDHAGAYNNMGSALCRQEKPEKALVHFREALRIDPVSAESNNNMGDALNRLGRVEEAIVYFTKALSIRSDNDNIHYNLGNAFLQQGKMAQAAMCYKKALRINPGNADAHNNLAILSARCGKTDEAIAHFRAAIQIRPRFTQAKSNLEHLLGDRGLP